MLRAALKDLARLILAVCATAVFATAVQADNIRYVSTTGSNNNDCTLAAPCKTLQRGINKTPRDGELRVLSSGDYGANANIGKPMTITGNGHTVVLGNPITVNDSDAGVALRGLVLNGRGRKQHGILITAAATVHIEGCVVHGFTSHGIFLSGATAGLSVIDSIARDNGGNGLYVQGNVNAIVTRSVAAGNALNGIVANSARMTVSRTTSVRNGEAGYYVHGFGQMTLESSEAHGNWFGLDTLNATARISNSVFVNNVTGIANSGGTVLTRQNNVVSGNTNQTVGTLTPLGGM